MSLLWKCCPCRSQCSVALLLLHSRFRRSWTFRLIVRYAEELVIMCCSLVSRVSPLFVVFSLDLGTLTSSCLWGVIIVWTSLYSVDYVSVCNGHLSATVQHYFFVSGAHKYLSTSCLLSARRATTSTDHREAQALPTVPGYLQYQSFAFRPRLATQQHRTGPPSKACGETPPSLFSSRASTRLRV